MTKTKTKTKKKIPHYYDPERMDTFKKEMSEKRAEAANPTPKPKPESVTIKRVTGGHWAPGQSGNPLGRNKLSSLERLMRAIRTVESEEDREELLVHYIKSAYTDHTVLINLIGKLHPSLQALALSSVEDNQLSDEEALAIQKKLKKRYEESETPSPSETAI